MEIGVLGFSGSKNIGDYIQTKAVIDILNTQNIKILDREKLNNYKGNPERNSHPLFFSNPLQLKRSKVGALRYGSPSISLLN